MPENTTPAPGTSPGSDEESDTLHTCACGEQHRHRPGGRSHRDECTSTLKFGETCCCGSGNDPKGDSHRCGHGPRCH